MSGKRQDQRFLQWVCKSGRVTVAMVAERSAGNYTFREAWRRLTALEDKGLLVRSGGGPRDAFWWSLPTGECPT